LLEVCSADQRSITLGAYAVFIEEKHIAVKGAVVASWKETMEMEYDLSYN
jgi:hypothetical protein